MAVSEAQKRAIRNYERKNVKCKTVRFYPKHMELFEWTEKRAKEFGSFSEYMRRLIENDLKNPLS